MSESRSTRWRSPSPTSCSSASRRPSAALPGRPTAPPLLAPAPRGPDRTVVDRSPSRPAQPTPAATARPARRGRLGTLLDDATAVLQSVVNEVAPGVVDVLDIDEIAERVDVQPVL